MPSEYPLKKNPIDRNRIVKLIKTFLDNIEEDRLNALNSFNYFKAKVDASDRDNQSKESMVECLKASSTAQNNGVKLLALLVQLNKDENKGSGKTGSSQFDDFDDDEED